MPSVYGSKSCCKGSGGASTQQVYKNERFFWTHYKLPAEQEVISNTAFFNYLGTEPRRIEASRTAGLLGSGSDWEFDPATKSIIWKGTETIPVSVECNFGLERVQRRRCLAMMFPQINGSDVDNKVFGNASLAYLGRGTTTSMNSTFYLQLAPNDSLQILLRKVNGTLNSTIRIRYVDVKIYTLRTEKKTDFIQVDSSPPASPTFGNGL